MTKRESLVVLAAGLVALAVIAVGVAVHAASGQLGTASPPFVMAWGPQADAVWTLVAVALLVALTAAAPRLLAVPRSPVGFAACGFAAALGVGLAVNGVRAGTRGWDGVFDLGPHGSFEAKNEVLAGLPSLSYGVHFFLDRFAELVPSQPVGLAGHPPGLPVLMHVAGIDTAPRLAALCIAALAAVTPATYALGRALGNDERSARRGALLAAAAPALVLFGISSTDAVFALAGTATAALLCARALPVRVAGCAALAISALLSWALLAIGAWAVLVAWRRDGARAAVALAAGSGVAVLALLGVLAAGYGYDPLGALRATEAVYRAGIATQRPYAFWVLGSPVAFAVTAGLPLTAAWLVAGVRRSAPALALAAIVVVSALLGFTKAEVERIWLPFVPLACVAASTVVADRHLRPVLALLGAQALVTELAFATVW